MGLLTAQKLGMVTQIGPPTGDTPLKFPIFFKKKQDGGGRHLEKQHKSRYHNNGLAGLHEI